MSSGETMRSANAVGITHVAWLPGTLALGVILALSPGCATTQARIEGIVVPPGDVVRSAAGAAALENGIVYAVPRKGVVPPRRVLSDGLRQTAGGFEPSVLFVTQNTEVELVNGDEVYHNAFSVSPAKRFDLDPLRPGEKRTVLFDSIGVVQIFCALHPESWGFVVVLPDGLYARPEPDGAFTLPRLPAGDYTLKVWHPSYGEKSRKVSVPRKGRVELKLAY
jgi:plastocyanin